MLYSNPSGVNSGSFTLSETAENFKYLEFFYGGYGVTSSKLDLSVAKNISMFFSFIDNQYCLRFNSVIAVVNGSTVTLSNYGYGYLHGNAAYGGMTEACVTIFKVIGYR